MDKMKIFYVNVIETNAGWGAECFIDRGFKKLGHEVVNLDFRKHRNRLAEKFLEMGDFDVFLLQRGDFFPIELIQAVNRPKLFWASELVTTCRDQDNLLIPGLFDHTFMHTKQCEDIVTSLGILNKENTSCIINGFDELAQYKIPGMEKDIDVLFIGNVTRRRREILDRLKEKFNVYEGQAFGEEMTKLFNRAKIVLNIHKSENLDTETRIFEGLGCGAFVISEKLSAENPFTDGELYVEAGTIDELEEKIAYYLAHDEERQAIAEKGYQEALSKHTYTARAEYIAGIMSKLTQNMDRSLPAIDREKVTAYMPKANEYQGSNIYRLGLSTVLAGIVSCIDENINAKGYTNLLVDMVKCGKYRVGELIDSIVRFTQRKDDVLTTVAVQMFIAGIYLDVLPVLQKAYEINPLNPDTVYNLGFVLNEFGEKELALSFLRTLENKDEGIRKLIEKIC